MMIQKVDCLEHVIEQSGSFQINPLLRIQQLNRSVNNTSLLQHIYNEQTLELLRSASILAIQAACGNFSEIDRRNIQSELNRLIVQAENAFTLIHDSNENQISQTTENSMKPEREGYFIKPNYADGLEQVLVIGAHQWGVTDAASQKPIIATDGLNACVAVVGYEPRKHQGFLIHFMGASDVTSTVGQLEQKVSSNNRYELRILGGTTQTSKARIERLMHCFQASQKLNGRFVEKDLFGDKIVRSIALDTRDGRVYEFSGLCSLNLESSALAFSRTPAVQVNSA